MRALARFLKLGWRDRLFLARCVFTVASVRLGLSLFSYTTLRRWLATAAASQAASDDVAQRIAWGVVNAARIVPGATCLSQAFAAQLMLARAGYRSQMRIGVAKDERGQFIAHAWLISNDRVVVGGSSEDLQRYVSLTDLSLEPP
jgi:Transglutaminase-like superfamily